MALSPSDIRRIAALSLSVPDEEIGCGDCADCLDRFAELRLRGLAAGEALPLVEEHLRQCRECDEEFEVLLEVLRSDEAEEGPWWRRFRKHRRRRR